MPRRARLLLPGVPLHIIQRGNNRQRCFLQDADYLVYLEWLHDHAGETGCRVHAYVLMSNHVHLLISFDDVTAPGALMKALGEQYVRYFNRRYGRSGTLWEGRYRSCLVQDEQYLLTCQRYIELNPVRAGLVSEPGEYRWSSHAGNTGARTDDLLTPHELYRRFGSGDAQRQQAYAALFLQPLAPASVEAVRKATNSNLVLGDPSFAASVGAKLGRRVVAGRPGRPPKNRGQTTFSKK